MWGRRKAIKRLRNDKIDYREVKKGNSQGKNNKKSN